MDQDIAIFFEDRENRLSHLNEDVRRNILRSSEFSNDPEYIDRFFYSIWERSRSGRDFEEVWDNAEHYKAAEFGAISFTEANQRIAREYKKARDRRESFVRNAPRLVGQTVSELALSIPDTAESISSALLSKGGIATVTLGPGIALTKEIEEIPRDERIRNFLDAAHKKVAEVTNVDENFAASVSGRVLSGLTQVLGFVGLSSLSLGAGGTTIFTFNYQESARRYRERVPLDQQNPEDEVLFALPSAIVNTALEAGTIGVVLGKIWKGKPKDLISMNEILARLNIAVTRGGKSATVNAVEETLQGAVLDLNTKLQIDPEQEVWTQERFLEAFVGFIVGGIAGTTVAGIQTRGGRIEGALSEQLIEESKALVAEKDKLITAKDGGALTSEEFKLLNNNVSQGEIVSRFKNKRASDILIRAMTGDGLAQQTYNMVLENQKTLKPLKSAVDLLEKLPEGDRSFVGEMAQVFNAMGRPKKSDFIAELTNRGLDLQDRTKASLLFGHIKRAITPQAAQELEDRLLEEMQKQEDAILAVIDEIEKVVRENQANIQFRQTTGVRETLSPSEMRSATKEASDAISGVLKRITSPTQRTKEPIKGVLESLKGAESISDLNVLLEDIRDAVQFIKEDTFQSIIENAFKGARVSAGKFFKFRAGDIIDNLLAGAELAGVNFTQQAKRVSRLISSYVKQNLSVESIRKGELNEILTQLGRATTPGQLSDAFKRIQSSVEKQRKRILIRRIDRILKRFRERRGVKLPKGRGVPADTLDTLRQIIDIRDSDPSEVSDEIGELFEELVKDRDSLNFNSEDRERLYLLERFGNLESKTEDQLQDAYNDIRVLITVGRNEFQSELRIKQRKWERIRKVMIDEITGGDLSILDPAVSGREGKGWWTNILKTISGFDTHIRRWEGVLDKITRKKVAQFEGFMTKWATNKAHRNQNTLTSYRNGIFDDRVNPILQEIFSDKKDSQIVKIMGQWEVPVDTNIWVNRAPIEGGEKVDVELFLSPATAAQFAIRYEREPDSHPTFKVMGYTKETIRKLREFAGPQLMKFVEQTLPVYQETGEDMNVVYRRLNHVDFPKLDNYTGHWQRDKRADPEEDALKRPKQITATINKRFQRKRVESTIPFDETQNSYTKNLNEHIEQVAHYIAWAETLEDFNHTFRHDSVRIAIERTAGRTAWNVIDKRFIDHFARGGIEPVLRHGVLSLWNARFAVSQLGLNFTQIPKQFVSFPAYMIDVPPGEFSKGQTSFWSAPIKNTKFLLQNSQYLKDRWRRGNERDVSIYLKRGGLANSVFGLRGFRSLFMKNVQLGDMAAILAGGWSKYRYEYNAAKKRGLSDAEAKKKAIFEFEKSTKRMQQSPNPEDMSDAQRRGPVFQLFTMFQSAPNLYYQSETSAIINAIKGRMSLSDLMRNLAITHFVLPALFQMASDGFLFFVLHWLPEEQREKILDRMKRALLLGSFNGILIASDWVVWFGDIIVGNEEGWTPEPGLIRVAKDTFFFMEKLAEIAREGDFTTDEIIRAAEWLAVPVGAATGVPISPVLRSSQGIYDSIRGDTDFPLQRTLGWSQWALAEEDLRNGSRSGSTESLFEF